MGVAVFSGVAVEVTLGLLSDGVEIGRHGCFWVVCVSFRLVD